MDRPADVESYNKEVTLRHSLALLAVFAVSTVAQAQLKQVQTVYLLPMGSGLDQYLSLIHI